MPYNIAANTQLTDPFAAADRRKALSQAFSGEELRQEMMQAELDAYPAQQAAAQREEQRKADKNWREEDEAARKQQKYVAEGVSGAAAAGVAAYNGSGGDGVAARNAFNAYTKNYFSSEEYAEIQEDTELDDNWDQEAALALLPKEEGIKPSAKMIEGFSMGLKPGTKEWNDWIRGVGEGNKPLAIEVKLELAKNVLHRTGQFEGISDEEQETYLDALGVQRGPKGSVTLKWDEAENIAEAIVARNDIGENFFGWDNEEFNDRLTFSIMRLAKDGKFGGAELEERALLDAAGYTPEDAQAALEEHNAGLPEEEVWDMMDLIKSLAE